MPACGDAGVNVNDGSGAVAFGVPVNEIARSRGTALPASVPTGIARIMAALAIVAVGGAVNVTVASPALFVVTVPADSDPALVESDSRCPETGRPEASRTVRVTTD
jgi:hypothetical protein